MKKKQVFIGLGLSLMMMSSLSKASIWLPEPDENGQPTIDVVRPSGRTDKINIEGWNLRVPEQLKDKLKYLGTTGGRISYGTEMFGLEAGSYGEQGGENLTLFGADYIVSVFRCNASRQIGHLEDSYFSQQSHEYQYVAWSQLENELYTFMIPELEDSYVFYFGAISKDAQKCYSASINTYGAVKQNLTIDMVHETMSFIFNPLVNSLKNVD